MTLYISPTRRLATMRTAMDRMVDEAIADITPREREMKLAVDVRANDDGYQIRALVPGITSEELNIEILNNTIAIRGEFPSFDESEDEHKYLACELPSGRFARVINLPTELNSAQTEASLKDGVLKLWVPKAEAHKPKNIQVKTA